MNNYSARDDLSLMLEDMKSAPKEFSPTNFWESGLPAIIEDLEKYGFENFREHNSASFFYSPNFRPAPTNLSRVLEAFLKMAQKNKFGSLRKIIDGSAQAEMDYLRFRAANDYVSDSAVKLDQLCESEVGGGEYFKFPEGNFGKSFLNYLRALTFLNKLSDKQELSSTLELGGGYGTLGEIVLKSSDSHFYMNVDIPPLAAVSTFYLKRLFGEEKVLSYTDSRSMKELDLSQLRKNYRAAVICPWQLPKLRGEFDLFANFMSFQEMEPEIVASYVSILQRLTNKYVLMRNSQKGKPIAETEGKVGVLNAVTTDFIVKKFDDFKILGRDSTAFGQDGSNSFKSEVILMERKSPDRFPP